jgi:putative transmembrane protein PGPGW
MRHNGNSAFQARQGKRFLRFGRSAADSVFEPCFLFRCSPAKQDTSIIVSIILIHEHSYTENVTTAKRLIVIVVGSTILLMGIAMIVLPGPAVLVIPVGLSVLATELVWARRLLNKLKSTFQKGKEKNHARETK